MEQRSGDRPPPARGATRFHAFGAVLARRHRLVVAVWLAVVAVAAVFVPRFESNLTGPPLGVAGSDSQRAQELLDTRFNQPSTEQVLIVFESATLVADDPAFRGVVGAALAAVQAVPGVVDVLSPFDSGAEGLVSADRRVATGVASVGGSTADRQRLAPRITEAAISETTPRVQVFVTGRAPLIAELVDQQRQDLVRAEKLGLPLALALLLLASGSAVAAGLPLLLAVAGMAVTFGLLGAAAGFAEFNLFVPNIATMIGLGVGIDYALFVVTRYREELGRGGDPGAATAAAVATAGRTVLFSGGTVLLSLAGLLVVDARIFRELAAGAMTAVAVMVLGALTLVPAVLAWLGHGVERFRLPGWRGLATASGDDGFWARWARTIMARPWLWTAVALAVLLALASPVARLNLSLDTGTGGIEQRSAAAGREILEREFNEGRISPFQVVYVSRDGPLDDGDLGAIARLSDLLANDWAVADVTSVTTLLDRFVGDHSAATLELAAGVPQAVEAASGLLNLERGRDVAVVRAVPRWSPDSPGPVEAVGRIRDRLAPEAIAGQDAEVLVGGLSAQIVDITAESERKLPVVVALVVALSYLLLAAVFRSLVLPAKAIAMNALGIAAAYGLLVVVFQEGAGAGLLGFDPTGSIQVYLPLLTFAVLFGLSMDYEVFLLSRIKEEWERSGDNRGAVAAGLQRSAGVITSAAAIMVAVFAAFVLARLTEVKALGFSLAAAVLIDATVVRIVLVPAAMQLMGRWNWWFPAWLDRILPRVDLSEGEAGVPISGVRSGVAGPSAPGPPRATKG